MVYLKIRNAGSLALKYQFHVDVLDEQPGTNVDEDVFYLSDYLMFGTAHDQTNAFATREDAINAVSSSAKALEEYTKSNNLLAGEEDYIALVVYMPTSVGNEANYKTGTPIPTIDLGINVFATQLSHEEDSFDNLYDFAIIDEVDETLTAVGSTFKIKNSSGTIRASGSTTNGEVITLTSTSTVDNSAVVINAVNASGAAVAISYDIEVAGHTAGTEVTVDIFLGTGLAINGFYHDGVAMTRVSDKGLLADGKYYYDETTGYLTFTTTSFSTFSAVVEKLVNWIQISDTSWYNSTDTTFTLNSAIQLAGLAKLTKNGNNFSGKTIRLGEDIDLAGLEWTPIGIKGKPFLGTFDGVNHTISNLSCNMPEAEYVGLFGNMWQKSGGVKNLIIDNATVTGDFAVGVLIGMSGSAVVQNISITGLVKVEALSEGVGCIAGYRQYGRVENINIDVDTGSYVKGYLSGGVLGNSPEGDSASKALIRRDITSNIDVYGTTHNSGGIAALSNYFAVYENCEVTGNVYLTIEDARNSKIGGIIGTWSASGTRTITVTNCSFSGNLYVGNNEVTNPLHNGLVGARYDATQTGYLIIDGVTYSTD